MRWPAERNLASRYGGLTVREDTCSYVWKIEVDKRCQFVQNTEDCGVEAFIDYPTILFCDFGTKSPISFGMGLLCLIIWLFYMFLILGTTADNFFCPNLSVIASVLRLSENIAGVTILAFGNGSPDIFTTLVSDESEQLIIFSELVGAGVFVSAVIAGSVVVIAPFTVQAKYFVRDALFYIAATLWIVCIMYDYTVYLWEAISCVFVYCLFIVTVVVMQHFDTRQDRRTKRIPMLRDPDVLRAFVENQKRDTTEPPQLPRRPRALDVRAKLDVAITKEMEMESRGILASGVDQRPASRPRGLFREFAYDLSPVNSGDWREASRQLKLLLLLRTPFISFLQLLVPVVNETAYMRGWSRLLNSGQIVFTPVFALVILELGGAKIGSVPILAICFVISLMSALLIFSTTTTDAIPKYHNGWAFMGFLSAMLVVYAVAQEVMAVLETIGFASGISQGMLGITLLAWGNSVGDLIANTAIARKGFPRMGFSACFGGPMFNTLLGLGLVWTIAILRSGSGKIVVRTGDLFTGCVSFLCCSLASSLIYLCVTGSIARKSMGFMLYTLYAVFMIINVLSELHVIHPLGTDHRPDTSSTP